QRRDNEVGKSDGCGARSEKEDPLLLELAPGYLERVDQSRKRDAGRALDVVIVAGDLVAVAGKQRDRIDPSPVLEVNAAVREDLLNRLYELVHKSVQLLARGPLLPQADVERIPKIGFVVRAGIQIHRQQAPRRHPCRRSVELQLPDR